MARRPDRPPIGSSTRSGAARPGAATRPGAAAGGLEARGTAATPTRDHEFTRPALAPGLLAAVGLVVGISVLDQSFFVYFRWGVTVFALIVMVFATRGRVWWAAVLTATIAVLWNPVVVVPLPDLAWGVAQPLAAGAFIAAGILVKVPREADAGRASRPSGR
jgi:hypothetical protein